MPYPGIVSLNVSEEKTSSPTQLSKSLGRKDKFESKAYIDIKWVFHQKREPGK